MMIKTVLFNDDWWKLLRERKKILKNRSSYEYRRILRENIFCGYKFVCVCYSFYSLLI